MGMNEDVIYPGVRMERLKELAGKQRGAINVRARGEAICS